MLKDIQIKNFKCFQDSGKLEIKPITFLVGPNSSGKSSIFQSILALRQTVRSRDPKSPLILQDYIDLGSFKDVVWKHNDKNNITVKLSDSLSTFEFEFTIQKNNNTIFLKKYRNFGTYKNFNGEMFNFDYEVDKKRSGYNLNIKNFKNLINKKISTSFESFYKIKLNNIEKKLTEKYISSKLDESKNKDEAKLKLKKLGIMLNHLTNILELEVFFNQQQQQIPKLFSNIFHIGPLRLEPQRVYTASGAFPLEVGKTGEWVVEELLSNLETKKMVNKWFNNFKIASDFKVEELKKGSKRYQIIIKEFYTGEWINIADVGFGASQILPIIVEGFISKDSTILIEQPEIHLHPSAQATMGDLLIDIAKNKKNNLIIETHSDLIISRVCTRIAEGKIDNSDVAIYYLEPTEEGTRVRDISINKDGQYENYPDGFFEERYDEAMMKADFIL